MKSNVQIQQLQTDALKNMINFHTRKFRVCVGYKITTPANVAGVNVNVNVNVNVTG